MHQHHDALGAEGWQRQTTIDEPRLSELAENYRVLGYEVLIVHGAVKGADAVCNECFKADQALGRRVGTLYIRPPEQRSDVDDGLF